MAFFDVLDPTLSLMKSRFLEASAGTGKTFAIEKLFIRLLEEASIEIEEILAITFTKEACGEMKERVLQALKESNSFLAKKALSKFEKIQIFTIHGFCLRMIQEHPSEVEEISGLVQGSQGEETFKKGLAAMRQIVVDLFLKKGLETKFDTSLEFKIALLLKAKRYDIDACIEAVVSQMHPSLCTKKREEKGLSSFFAEFGPICKERFIKDCQLLAGRYKRVLFSSEELEQFGAFLETQNSFYLWGEKRWFFEKMEETNVKVGMPSLDNYALDYPDLFLEGSSCFKACFAYETDYQTLLEEIALLCYRAWEKKAALEHLWSFDTLLVHMQAAVQNPIFAKSVREKYKMVIVDEFQDTDPLQWKLIEQLFLQKKPLYLVGDPKQSIYSFRRADLAVYFQAKEAMGEESVSYLHTNYRSAPKLVECLNSLFMKHPPRFGPVYMPVLAGRSEGKLTGTVLHCPLFTHPVARGKSFPSKAVEEEEIFPYMTKEILRLQKEEGVSLDQIAILIKDRFQAERLKTHLQNKGVSASIKRVKSLAQTQGFRAIWELLRAICYIEESAYEAAVSYGPLCLSKKWEKEILEKSSLSSYLRALFEQKGFSAFIEECLETYFLPPRSLYLECRLVVEALMETGSRRIDQLLQKMKEFSEEKGPLPSSLEVQEEEGEKALSILTIFASKGLEFDIVFSLATASRYSGEEEEGKEEERIRQFYVALTRAKERIYLPLLFEEKGGKTAANELFFAPWKDLLGELETVGATYEWVAKQDPEEEKRELKRTERSFSAPPSFQKSYFPTWVYSFSSLSSSRSRPGLVIGEPTHQAATEEERGKTIHTLPKGKETGVLLHTLLERILGTEPKSCYESQVKKLIAGTLLEGWEEVIVEMVNWVLISPLVEEEFSLDKISRQEMRQEMEFLFFAKKKGGYVKGVIDLVFRYKGKFYLLDWKTNWLGENDAAYTIEKIEEEMKRHKYYLQASLYLEALSRYLKGFGLSIESHFGGVLYVFLRGKKTYKLSIDSLHSDEPLPLLISQTDSFEIGDPRGRSDEGGV